MPIVVIARGPWSINTAQITSTTRLGADSYNIITQVGNTQFSYLLTLSEAEQLNVSVPNDPDSAPVVGSLIAANSSLAYASDPLTLQDHSFQPIAPDLNVAAAVGSNTSGNPKFIAAGMFNIIGAALTRAANYLAGLIGAYSLTGAKASTYPTGALQGIVMDTVTDVDGCVTAVVDGDSGVTKSNAAFKYMMNNSNVGSGVDYGVDLFGAAHDGYNEAAVLKADLRLSKEVCLLNGAGVPADGGAGTGAGFAEIGSQYMDRTNGNLYLNAGTKAAPTWKLVTRAA